MNLKVRSLLLLLLALSLSGVAQENAKLAEVRGRLMHTTHESTEGMSVRISYQSQLVTADTGGNFTFSNIPYGTYSIFISGNNIASDTIKFIVNKEIVDLGKIRVINYEPTAIEEQMNIPTIAIEEGRDADEEGLGDQSISGILSAGRDPFLNTAAYVWSAFRFSARGYKKQHQQVLINGALVNDAKTDNVYWGQWGGLNDMFRGRTSSYGLQPFDYGFGGLNGAIYLDATAANQRKQTKVTYSLSNRQYRHRLMLTHSSGPLKDGWSYAASFSKRWAKEGYAPGSFYDGYSWFLAASKTIKEKHKLSVTTFGAPTRKGTTKGTYKEAYELAGTNYYNPSWGYQNGEKRNAKVASSFQPVILLYHEYAPSSNTRWSTVAGYQFGKSSITTLDWHNAPDPRPDYYRYLPNFYLLNESPDTLRANAYSQAFSDDPQIKWDDMYQANYGNLMKAPDNSFAADSARRSLYVLGNDVDDVRKWMFNTSLQKAISDQTSLFGGFSFINQRNEIYRELLDLLGGEYFVNINAFAERVASGTTATTYSQYDINHPDRIVKEGDRYYYNYLMRQTKASVWVQGTYSSARWDLFLSGNIGITSFQREGSYRNGLYASGNASYGKSARQRFTTYGVKAGATFKLNGRNYLFLNGAYGLDAPSVANTFYAARVRNATVGDPINQKNYSVEGGYLLRSPKTNVRAVVYATDIKDQVTNQRFYYQGTGSANTFVNYVLQHMDTRSIGTELAISQQLSPSFTVTGVAAMGQSFYTNNPVVTIYQENTPDTIPQTDRVYIKNYYLGVGPQSTYSLAVNYRSKRYWYGTITCNYLDRNYINVAAPRHTEQTVELVTPGTPEWHAILDQEKFTSAFTVDLFFGKSVLLSRYSKRLPRNTFVYLNVGINNLLDNINVRTSGFENPRFDYTGGYANKFAPTYAYAYGRNFFINLALKF